MRDLSVDEIHKIREANYEKTKNMDWNEKRKYCKQRADKVRERMLELKEEKEKYHASSNKC